MRNRIGKQGLGIVVPAIPLRDAGEQVRGGGAAGALLAAARRRSSKRPAV
jgi:hypothetical protein